MTHTSLGNHIATYRTATLLKDNHSRDIAGEAIRQIDEGVLYALLDETVARGQIARLDSIGQSIKSYKAMLANALSIIADAEVVHQVRV